MQRKLTEAAGNAGDTYHIRPESEDQRKRVELSVQSTEHRGAPRLTDFSTPWDPMNGELRRNKKKTKNEAT